MRVVLLLASLLHTILAGALPNFDFFGDKVRLCTRRVTYFTIL